MKKLIPCVGLAVALALILQSGRVQGVVGDLKLVLQESLAGTDGGRVVHFGFRM